ncbi:hypothetical protein F4808DRAFT_429610 [Astrocystis sublimbata]|nr:hypothetical protein F4808DRAFT_429610 [Astrocystis sublimbata]
MLGLTNASENTALSGKPLEGQDQYCERPALGLAHTGPNTGRAPVQPLTPTPGYMNGLENPHPNLQPRMSPAQINPPADIMQRGDSSTPEELGPVSGSPIASHTMAAQGIIGHDDDDGITDGRKAKRELSQSKRAAQNRAAQRAFRQRKEHYIKKLEQQVREHTEIEQQYKTVQNDNYALREYVIQLQARLIDLHVELPQPPPNVNITQPASTIAAPRQPPHNEPPAETTSNAPGGTLADVALAVAGLGRAREQAPEGRYATATFKSENTGAPQHAEPPRRQQPPDGLPPPSSLR